MIDDVESVTIDDFVLNGADQLLLEYSSKPGENTDNSQLGRYLITDCEGIHIVSGEGDSVCT